MGGVLCYHCHILYVDHCHPYEIIFILLVNYTHYIIGFTRKYHSESFVLSLLGVIFARVAKFIVTHNSALNVGMAPKKNGGSNQCISSYTAITRPVLRVQML